jgi:predicted transcriptional regulator
MDRDPELPPPLEMVCLCALWRIGEGNVEDVRRAAGSERTLAYTTVLTLLDRLTRRGAVARRKEGRAFRYRPAVERSAVRAKALDVFLHSYFESSEADLKVFLEERAAGRTNDAPAAAAAATGE